MEKELQDKLLNIIEDEITNKISQHIQCIGSNIKHVFGKLLYQIKLDLEKDGFVGEIDKLIDIVISTSRIDCQSETTFDEEKCREITNRI
jgi:hypothetical protein